MGVEQLWGLEWNNANEQRAYPLAETATRVDRSGSFRLPDSFLVGLYLPVAANLAADPTNFFLKRVAIYATGFGIVVGYDDGTADPPTVAQAVVARAAHEPYNAYALSGANDFSAMVGRVAVGRVDEIDLEPHGAFDFSPDGGRLDPDCVRPATLGVTALVLVSGGDTSPPIRGDVELVAGTNVALSFDGQVVRIDAIDGAGLTSDCACEGDTALAPPIRTVNGVPPDADGNFTIEGNKCVQVTAAGHGLTLADLCSQPCCGCPELEALAREVRHVGEEETALGQYLSRVAASVDQFNAVVLGSRLGDYTCTTCGPGA